MSTLRTAFTLTSIAFMIGVGVVLASIQYRHFGASFDTGQRWQATTWERAASAMLPMLHRPRPVQSISL